MRNSKQKNSKYDETKSKRDVIRDSDPFHDEAHRIAREEEGEVFSKCSCTVSSG